MGATYTRQSSSAIVDGGVIEASDLNAEFNQILAAFEVSTGHTHDGTAGEGGPVTKLLGSSITIGDGTAGNNIAVTFDGETGDGVLTWMEDEDYFQFSDDILISSTEKLQFRDTAIYINSSADGQLDLVADTEIQIAATTIDINGAVDISGALTLAGTTLAETIADTVGAMVSSNTETGITVTYDDSDNTLDFVLGAAQTTITSLLATDIKIGEDNETKIDFETANEIHFYAANTEQVYLGDNIFGPQSDSDVDLGSTGVRWKDAFIDSITTTGNVTVGGDLTVSGDDITMGTNTAGNLLVADGTNFNSIAVSSLSEISTAAADDVFVAIDTSGGGLKKIARSAVVAGLATDSAISNVVDDTTPQLGGNLDMNGADIVTTSNATIDLAPNGTGTVVVRGNTNSGAIVFNCESNSHGQKVIAQPHSAGVTNVMLLPAGADSTLVSLVSTDTLTNKTLTSPKVNEDVAVTSTATELNILDGVTATTAEINLIDGDTARGTTAVVDADGILHNDGGTMRMTSAATFKTYFTSGVSSAADDITAGDAAVGITTSSGNITVDSNAGAISIDGHTGVTLASSNSGDITLDSVADIILDAAGNDFSFKAGGTEILKITNSSSDVIIKPIVDAKDLIFQQRDGTEVARIEDNGTFNVVTSKLAINGTAVTSTAAELNLLDGVSGLVQADLTKLAAVDSTAAELNIVDGGTSATSTTVADADRVVLNDAGTMVQVAMTDIKTYIGGGTSWQAVKTGDYTAAAGQGVFANTTSASFTVTLPASPDLGDEVSIKDYAGTFDTNALTIGRNSQPIEGVAADLTVSVERAGLTLAYSDSTQGWLLKDK